MHHIYIASNELIDLPCSAVRYLSLELDDPQQLVQYPGEIRSTRVQIHHIYLASNELIDLPCSAVRYLSLELEDPRQLVQYRGEIGKYQGSDTPYLLSK